jgi:hypothetical protein
MTPGLEGRGYLRERHSAGKVHVGIAKSHAHRNVGKHTDLKSSILPSNVFCSSWILTLLTAA